MHRNVSPSSRRIALTRSLHDPLVFGSICGLISAVGYTAANICLRAVAHSDPVWVSCVKAMPTVILFGPFLLVHRGRGERIIPTARVLGILIVASVICQLFGNVAFQWSLGVVGIALTVPLTLGAMIISGAVMGRVFLHEPVTPRMAISTLVLILAICVLSLGAGEASQSVLSPRARLVVWFVFAGVAMACLSGVAYALLGVVIRYGVTGRVSVTATLVIVTLTGVVSLGTLSFWRIGWSGMVATPLHDFAVMVMAGVFNALAFLALTKSLQLIPVIYVNALNASQAAMAAVAGILFFAEPPSAALWFGVALTMIGLLLMHRRRVAEEAREQEERPEPSSLLAQQAPEPIEL